MFKNSKIKSIEAREILDSRANPTIEVELKTKNFSVFASVPSGASKGKYEAKESRDNKKRYGGKGVLEAVKNINEIIAPKLRGKDVKKQKEIDDLMIELDGTKDKSKLGANAILAVSMAVCRAGAKTKNIPLYKYIAKLSDVGSLKVLPKACFNVINGGVHSGNELDIQEFMIIPQKKSFSKNLQTASEIYYCLKEILKENFGKFAINIGDEGGFIPPVFGTKSALGLLVKAIRSSGYKNIKIGLDCAASQFSKEQAYLLEKVFLTKQGLLDFYQDLIKDYPIIFLEDPFSEEDWEGFSKITKKIGKKISIIGDDLLCTNPERIKQAKERNACNGMILKPNQIGTITEALKAAELAKSFDWKIMVSHRSGDTCDDFISDLAVGISADFIKAGAPARGERVAKYNRLLKIEEEIINKQNKYN
ncbi:phosphopyruvate hydratase [Candidatus Parcubacteria bacterium]|nr:phosphopyruvate hydratase [Candidatus Parcubacteria bacterium]